MTTTGPQLHREQREDKMVIAIGLIVIAVLATALINNGRVAGACWAGVLGVLVAAGLVFAGPFATIGTGLVLVAGAAGYITAVEHSDSETRAKSVEAAKHHARIVGSWIAQALVTGLVALAIAVLTGRKP